MKNIPSHDIHTYTDNKNKEQHEDIEKILSMDKELQAVVNIIQETGKIVLKYYGGSNLDTKYKENEFDPVTQADMESETYIIEKIRENFPDDKILSEETENDLTDFTGRVWMIDPLDGTKDFIEQGDAYSIMIGLCVDGIPTVGAVFTPSTGNLYYAKKGRGCFFMNEITKKPPKKLQVTPIDKITEATCFSKSKFSEMRASNQKIKETIPFKEIVDGGSLGVVMGAIAAGKGECYILTNHKSCKWDACAPQILVEEAGGMVTDIDGGPVDYLTGDKRLNNLLIATNGHIHQEVLEKIQGIFKKE